jgi:Protein of unknown function (DUF3617)
MRLRVGMFGACVLALGIAAGPALALHGKAGLWQLSVRMNMANLNIPPEQLTKMKAMGINLPNSQTISATHCMTPDEVSLDRPINTHSSKNCTFSKSVVQGDAIDVDLTCSAGNTQETGHISVTYDGNEHFVGDTRFTGTANGHTTDVSTHIEGRWLSPDCGKVTH